MAYTKTNWVNDSTPAINATNLNKIETGIDEAHTEKEDLANKTTSFQATPDNTRYPTEKLVKDSLDLKANIDDVLKKDNTTSYTPSGDYNPSTKKYVDDGLANKANIDNVLEKDNTTSYTPTSDYHPATKKYVDDISGGGGGGGLILANDESVNYGEIVLNISGFTVAQNSVVMFTPKTKTTTGTHLSQISINGSWYPLKTFRNESIKASFFDKIHDVQDIYLAYYDSTNSCFYLQLVQDDFIPTFSNTVWVTPDNGYEITPKNGKIDSTVTSYRDGMQVIFKVNTANTVSNPKIRISLSNWKYLKMTDGSSPDVGYFKENNFYLAYYDSSADVFIANTITQNNTKLKIETLNISNIPTSDTGIEGDVWNDNGTLKIVEGG